MRTDEFDAGARATARVGDALQEGRAWHQLCDAILLTLDRDNALRHTYLRRRWQGHAPVRTGARGRPE